jgi:hypothetical protein
VWKKYFKVVDTNGSHSPISGARSSGHNAVDNMGHYNYGSMLPEVYMGHPNRVERYNQYEAMDLDAEVNSALDILSEFCTQVDAENGMSFALHFKDEPNETEVKILKKQLRVWYHLNQFEKRTFKIFRNVLKYGDQVFLRDPETFKLFWVDMTNVIKVIVNESDGKKPEQYVVRNINPNFENLTVTQVTADNLFYTAPNTAGYGAAAYNMPNNPYSTNNRFTHGLNEKAVEAQHILHLSLTEGLDPNWPFGNSILELIFKVYKQKELLEDAIVIYRIQRAPERRVFYIDVGNMPSHLAMAFVDRVKNEIHQRRIPTHGGGTGNYMDSTYSPLCLDLATRIPLLDGRTLPLAELITEYKEGKKNWAYSCHPVTGKIVPGPITWAGVTRESAKVIKLTLDNDESVILTPDHKIPVLGKGFVEAQNISKDDCLFAFNTRQKSIDYNKWGYSKLKRILAKYGYKGFKHFVAEASYFNHRIKNVEWLEQEIPVGTITIDGEEKYHNYHTFAIESGIFVKNSVNQDFFFPQTSEGRGSKVELLPGGQNLSEIDDLRYFTNKMMRGLRIPSSYLPTGPDDSPATVNDGRVGTALIQEFRFNQYCQRLQNLVVAPLDTEFKTFLKWSGINIDSSLFELRLNEPQNFAKYREAEMDGIKIGTFTQLEQIPYFSKRFLSKRFLGLSDEEILTNEEMWNEENIDPDENSQNKASLRDVGITPGGIETDLDTLGPIEPEEGENPEGNPEGGPGGPVNGAGPAPTGAGAEGPGAGAPTGGGVAGPAGNF